MIESSKSSDPGTDTSHGRRTRVPASDSSDEWLVKSSAADLASDEDLILIPAPGFSVRMCFGVGSFGE